MVSGACALVAAACLHVLLTAAPAHAQTGSQASLDRSIAFLQGAQNADGGFGADAGEGSEPGFTAWASLALAAAGINPQAQRAPDGTSAYAYLTGAAPTLTLVPDFERALLVADAAGGDPHDFGGRDLVASILAARLPDGSFPYRDGEAAPDVNDTSFAVLALSLVHEPEAQAAVARGAQWLIEERDADGSWPSGCPRNDRSCAGEGGEPAGELDATAAAIEALNAAGLKDTEAQRSALEWMRSAELSDGGLPEYPGEGVANVASTAWGAQALWSAELAPESWTSADGDPLSYLASLQQPDGSVDWREGVRSAPVWMTAYVAPALAGRPLPIHEVPMPGQETAPVAGGPATTPPPATDRAAAPDEAAQEGVRTAGGGRGAQLFSRPQPQSVGRTAGGERATAVTGRSSASRAGASTPSDGFQTPAGNGPATTAGAHEVTGLLLAAKHSPVAPGLATARGAQPGATLAALLGLAALGAFALGAGMERRRLGGTGD